MATLAGHPTLGLTVTIRLTEEEARAFDALVGYGDDAFIKHFYETLGAAYMRDHERGLRTMFQSIRDTMPGILGRMDDARKVFTGKG